MTAFDRALTAAARCDDAADRCQRVADRTPTPAIRAEYEALSADYRLTADEWRQVAADLMVPARPPAPVRRCWCGRRVSTLPGASGFECAEHDDPVPPAVFSAPLTPGGVR